MIYQNNRIFVLHTFLHTMSKVHVRKIKSVALTISRPATREKEFVYIAIANKRVSYLSNTKSRIVYIGQTNDGAYRLGTTAAERAYNLLFTHGVSTLTYYIIVPRGHRGLKDKCKVFETALLSEFKAMYGTPPKANKQSKNYNFATQSVVHARKFFTDQILRDIIIHYGSIGD